MIELMKIVLHIAAVCGMITACVGLIKLALYPNSFLFFMFASLLSTSLTVLIILLYVGWAAS